jgi:hypothetical protein
MKRRPTGKQIRADLISKHISLDEHRCLLGTSAYPPDNFEQMHYPSEANVTYMTRVHINSAK